MARAFNNLAGLILLALLALLLLLPAYIALTGHANGNHVGELHSSQQVHDILEAQFMTPKSGPCAAVEVAICPLARCQDRLSCRFGQSSPQIKVACQLAPGDKLASPWIVGIIGTRIPEEPIFVTGFDIPYGRFRETCARDKCQPGDVTIVQNIFIPPGALHR